MPDPSAFVARRNETLTPLQSLALLNNPFMVRMAEQLAARIEPIAAPTPTSRSSRLGDLRLDRIHNRTEMETMVEYADRCGLANACRLIFNMNEFVFVD